MRYFEINEAISDYDKTLLKILNINKKELRSLYLEITDMLSVIKNPYHYDPKDINEFKELIIPYIEIYKNAVTRLTYQKEAFKTWDDPEFIQWRQTLKSELDDMMERAIKLGFNIQNV